MQKITDFFDLKKPSVLLIVLPYLAFNYNNIIQSAFYSYIKLISILAYILLLDLFIKWILLKVKKKIINTISLFIVCICILFFYGLYLATFIQATILADFHYLIRGRSIIEFLLCLFILLIFILKNKKLNYQYLNVFLILFSATSLFISISNTKKKIKVEFKSSFVSIPVNNSSIKPVILIISDEYTSPDGLYQIYRDSSLYQFSNKLAQKGWITKNSFYSYEISTIHSLSSLFNFNLSKNSRYKNEAIADIAATQLVQATIVDSLEKKNVKILNFGIFHIGKFPYLNLLYPYPTSFIEDIMMHTIYYTIKSNTGNLYKSGLANDYYPMEAHNKYIFNHLADTLYTLTKPKHFIYTHLYMPHGPIQYSPEFSIRTVNNIINYKAYWNFTNHKLNTLLNDLIKTNNYRIILTGDHGYRGDKRINPHYTFTAFYGFSQKSIESIHSVQDLGSLINASY